jgi:hypothetical protein
MSESSLRAASDAAQLCERCGRREAATSWAAVWSIQGVPSPPLTRQVCTECAEELQRVPADLPAHINPQTFPAPRGVLAKVHWAWRLWRFARAVRRARG